ncbi:hypothetical protein N008_09275 [Hymenobacter sp. APR13]|nr:hypothetical protein N008_09275 [Hymenobacter sp. APR13]
MLLACLLMLPQAWAQQVLPTPPPPALVSSISDLLPPSFRSVSGELTEQDLASELMMGTIVQPQTASRPQTAPTLNNGSFTRQADIDILRLFNPLARVTNGGTGTITAIRVTSLPDAAQTEFGLRNSTTGVTINLTTVPVIQLLSSYDQIYIRPRVNRTFSTNFQFQLINDANEISNTSTVTLNFTQIAVALPHVSQIVPAGAPATPLTEPLSFDPDGLAASSYRITTIPTAAEGVLALDGAPITVNQVLTPTEGSRLTFDPAPGYFGTAVFDYNARDAAGTNFVSTSYGIPVAKAICGQASTLNFADLADTRNFQTAQSIVVEGVTITASNYTAPSNETTFRIEDNGSLPGKTLAWTADYSLSANNTSSVDFAFSRPLENFSMAISDIDRVGDVWTDQLQIDGFTATGQLISLSAADAALAPNGSNAFSSPNQITGQGNANNFGPRSNVVLTFPQPLVRVRLTYRNVEPITNPGGQLIGINSMSWCSVVDVYTRFTAGPVAANVGNTVSYTVEFGNNGPDEAQQVTRTVTLPAGATNVTGPAGATYNSTTRVIDFGPAATLASGSSNSFTFGFTVPATAGGYSVVSNTSTPGNENGATANNSATRALTVNDCNSNNLLNYTLAATPTGSRKTSTETFGSTTATYSNFTSTAPVGQDNFFDVENFVVNGTTPLLSGKALSWIQNYTNLPATNQSTVTLTFAQPVNNLTLVIDDIDASTQGVAGSDFIDVLRLDGFPTSTSLTAATLTAANFTAGTTNSFSGNNSLTGNNNAVNTRLDDAATISFTTPVQRLVLTYSNTRAFTANNNRLQAIGIQSISYCNQPLADLQTTVTAVASPVNAGTTGQFNITFTNAGPQTAIDIVRQVQLPTGLTNVVATNGGTYSAVTGLVTYPVTASLANGANVNSTITFTAPAGGVVTASSLISGDVNESGNTANNSASGTITVTPVADVTTLVSGPTSVVAGQPAGTYTASFSNNGPSSASAVPQTVTLPEGVTDVVIPRGATYNATTRVIDFGTAAAIAAGTVNTFQFSFTAPATPGSVSVASSTGTTTSQGANTAPDQATLALDVRNLADVAVVVTATNASVVAGAPVEFTAVFRNNGPTTARNVTRQVQLPAGLVGVVLPDGGTYNNMTGVVTFDNVAALAANASQNLRIQLTAPAAMVTVVATGSTTTTDNEQGQTANNSSAAPVTVSPAFDLLTRISGPATTVAGTLATFSVVTQNNGPSAAANVVQTAQLPTGLLGVFVSNGGTYNSATGVVTFPAVPAMSSGTSLNNTISFLAPATGFTATASVTPTSGDTNTANNTASAPATTVTAAPATRANLFTTITSNVATVAPGGAVTFTVTQGNDGPDPSLNVVQRISLPAGLTNVSVSGGGNYDNATGVVTFPQINSQASGASTSYTITVNNAPATGVLAAVANVGGATPDPMPANNVATADVRVNPLADVLTTLSGPASATAGQLLTYTVLTANAGNTPAANVVQTVQIPAGLTGVTVSGGGSYNDVTGVVSFPAITVQQPGNSVSNTISYAAPVSGTLNNVAAVSTTTAETAVANNRAAVTTTVAGRTDVSVSIAGPATAVAGNLVTYAVTTTNNGASAALNTVTSVQLPKGLTGVSATGGGNYDPATGLVTFTAVPSQPVGSVTNTISFVAPATSTLVATANTAANNEDVLTNNSATTSTTLAPATTPALNLTTTITSSNPGRAAGAAVTFTVSSTNSAGSATTATKVQQVVYLPAGLTGVVVSDGGSYDEATGVVTFPVIASLAAGASTPAYTIRANTPASDPFRAVAMVGSDQSETTTADNTATVTVNVNERADVTTVVTGPATASPGATVTYGVVTRNDGISPAANTVQQVQLPANLTNVVVSGGGNYVAATGLVTFPTITALQPGTANQLSNTISFTAPAAAFDVVGTVSTATNQGGNTAPDQSTQATAPANQPPTANAVVNALKAPFGETAGPLPISPLSGRDADGTLALFTISSVPPASQGVLRYNNAVVTPGTSIPAADADKLTFDAAPGFVGNAFFTYTTTDNAGAVSQEAIYTIPVGQDTNSLYTNSPVKGGSANPYQNNDPIATVFDVNGGRYSSAGAVTANGLTSATTNTDGTNQLATLGLQLDPVSGLISVQNRLLLRAGTYTVQVTTVDAFGGTNTQPVTFTIGAAPLPVVLVSFDVQAVGTDARLNWKTAQETNSSHFVVLRSLNGGASFSEVERVQAQGTKSSATTYSYLDKGVGRQQNGTVYYRLEQVDQDGTSVLTEVKTVFFKNEQPTAVQVYPNPASDQQQVRLDLTTLPAGSYKVTLTDMAGRVVQTVAGSGGLEQALEVASLPQGSYLVQVIGQAQVYTTRFVKK